MGQRRMRWSIWAMAGLLAGCPAPDHVPVANVEYGATPTPAASFVASPSAAPSTSPSVLPDAPVQGYSGVVLGLDGSPAAGVDVRGYLISDLGSSLVGEGGGRIISNNGGTLRLLATDPLATRTDAQGRFTLPKADGPINVEAVRGNEEKAIAREDAPGGPDLTLRLAPTGTLAGRVTAPNNPNVTDFEGVDVFIPGTGYVAKTDHDGRYAISYVPAGSFDLVATRASLGKGRATAVGVRSGETTTAPDIALTVTPPTIDAITPANAGPGATVTLRGANFGSSAGDQLAVTMSGLAITAPRRIDDRTLAFTVPDNAITGDVVVTVGGFPSAPQRFTVIKTLAISPRPPRLVTGSSQQFTVKATDTAGRAIDFPLVTWSATGDALTVDAKGLGTAKVDGNAVLAVSSGNVKDELPLRVATSFGAPVVSTFAGSGVPGLVDGKGLAAGFSNPISLVFDAAGTLYVSDRYNYAIRAIAPDGTVSTVAGTGQLGWVDGRGATARFNKLGGIALDREGNLLVADRDNGRIRKIDLHDPAHPVSTVAGTGDWAYQDGPALQAKFTFPEGIAAAPDGAIYVADNGDNRIRKISPDGQVTTIAGTGAGGRADGPGASATFSFLDALALGPDGRLYASDSNAVRVIDLADPAYPVATYAGGDEGGHQDGPALQARFAGLDGIAFDGVGNLFAPQWSAQWIAQISPTGQVTTIAGTGDRGKQDGDGPKATFAGASGVAVDGAGNLYIADSDNNLIRKITF